MASRGLRRGCGGRMWAGGVAQLPAGGCGGSVAGGQINLKTAPFGAAVVGPRVTP